jgi:murein L,D-transpeptidase YcbB/YkuD
VPHKLAVVDKLPEIQKDPDYLSRMGFTVYHAGTSNVADPSSIDWMALSRSHFPYRLIQAPGPLNALGQVKFMFPNEYDVYLHDTSARDLFNKTERAFSSGCIRVSDPIELAEVLLSSQGWDKQRIHAVLDSGQTTTVYLESPVAVHLEYWTAWVDKVGKLNFRNDIYKRDKAVWQALNQPMQ